MVMPMNNFDPREYVRQNWPDFGCVRETALLRVSEVDCEALGQDEGKERALLRYCRDEVVLADGEDPTDGWEPGVLVKHGEGFLLFRDQLEAEESGKLPPAPTPVEFSPVLIRVQENKPVLVKCRHGEYLQITTTEEDVVVAYPIG